MSQISQININGYIANVSFSISKNGRTIKLIDFTSFEDIKDEINYVLPYGDNHNIVKLEHRSLSIGNEGEYWAR